MHITIDKTVRRKRFRFPRIILVSLSVLLIHFSFFVAFATKWYRTIYGVTGFDSILFTLQSSLSGTQSTLVQSFLLNALVPALILSLGASFVLFFPHRFRVRINNWSVFPFSYLLSIVFALSGCAFLLTYSVTASGFHVYVRDQLYSTDLYTDEYISPDSVEITFPEEKRNLVYIMLESMETTYLSEELGGASDVNLIPELTELAQEGINFSHNDTVGGFHATNGATWTIGSIVAQTAGIPLKTPVGLEDRHNGYGTDGIFLPGVRSITNILDEAGYYTSFLCGSDASFGGRKPYYVSHGMDEIYDIHTARRDGIVPADYFVWWGMEDLHLFEYARQELTEISQLDEPFAFTMLTVDTHHIGGYQCAYCRGEFEEPYEQSIACSSRQVLEFVNWLKAQPFWDNTTVVITGDHLSMDNGYFQRNVDDSYDRMVYNCILNSPVTATHIKNRDYCAVDLFPTTLAAMGCTIEGDRLGLGVNLFSNRPTLSEKLGFNRFNEELGLASEYYTEHFQALCQ